MFDVPVLCAQKTQVTSRQMHYFATRVTWCGRHLSKKGISYEPGNISGLKSMRKTTKGRILFHFLSAMKWICTRAPNISVLVQQNLEALERSYKLATKRTESEMQRSHLSNVKWSQRKIEAFNNWQKALQERVTLVHRDESQRLCLYLDVCDTHWAVKDIQVPHADMNSAHIEERNQPLAFPSGHFSGAKCLGSLREKKNLLLWRLMSAWNG